MIKSITLTFALFSAALGSILAQKPEMLIDKADKLYSEGKYQDAISNYEAVVGQGLQNAELYYNLGNAYFKVKNIPAAILNFERAHLLNPEDEDVKFNLDLSRTYTIDKIETLPDFFLVTFVKNIRNWFNTNTWAYIAAFAFTAILSLILFFWFSRSFEIRRYAFSVAVMLSIVFIISLVFSVSLKNQVANRNHAIVFAPVVSAKSSPDDSGKDLFILHAGAKVELIRPVGDWCEIKIADGNKGWIHKETFQKI
ncbi:MAG: tetratricopeptide repeat protein [Bacteroidales bacterium]